uniref:Protein phosphatase 1 regulatory subunit 3C2, duplicate b n=1 Tax=Kryptolebias marmoratus TaxID=37003 RepID=A0A3Q2ZSC6_KRYMA
FSCINFTQKLTSGPNKSVTAGLVEIAVRLCLNQRKHLCPHVWVPILKPLRPCIRSPVSEHQARRVVFADSLGFSLAAVRVFSEEEGQPELGPLPSLQGLGGMTGDGYSCTVSTCCPGTRLKLGFPQPSVDFQAFRAKLAESMVTLESCTVTEQALQGTVRVRNLCLQKDVRVRITFDSWGSYRDVPCLYLQKRFGGPQTDIFEFDVAIPKILDAKRKIEFCLMYLPGGQSEPFWDNNNGQNYSILVCVKVCEVQADVRVQQVASRELEPQRPVGGVFGREPRIELCVAAEEDAVQLPVDWGAVTPAVVFQSWTHQSPTFPPNSRGGGGIAVNSCEL